MSFLNPSLLYLLALGIIPLALYFFRRKSKRFNVSTMVFFKTLAREHQESAWLRRLKKFLSLLMTLIIFCSVIFALSRLIVSPGSADEVQTVVVVIDRSASMAVEGEDGVSRLDAAILQVKNELLAVPEDVGIALVAYDVRPEILQPRTLKRRELISRLAEIAVSPMAGDSAAALETAEVLAKLKTPAAIWHLSDVMVPTLVQLTDPVEEPVDEVAAEDLVTVREMPMAIKSPINVGITAFKIRPVPLEHGQFDAFVQIALNEDAPADAVVSARLEVYVGGIPAYRPTVELKPGQREQFEFKLEGAENQMLRLSLVVENDALPLDNTVLAPLPAARPVVVAWVRPDPDVEPADPYLQIALRALHEEGELELYAATPDTWPIEGIDVAIFDRWLPEPWPENLPAIVINPPGNSGPILARPLENGIPYDNIRVGNEEHPVLFRVSSSRIGLTQTTLFSVTGSLEPLWLAGQEAVLAAGEVKGQRIVLMGFTPGQSERLPFLASFPILMGNALLWAVETSPGLQRKFQEHSTGDFAEIRDAKAVMWSRWEDGRLKKTRVAMDEKNAVIELDRIGVFETEPVEADAVGQMGSAFLLSAAESNVPGLVEKVAVESQEIEKSSAPERKSAGWFRGDLTALFLGLIVLFLIVESWLFHRHSVY